MEKTFANDPRTPAVVGDVSTRLLLAAVAACAMLGATPARGAGPLVLNEPTGIAVEPGGALLVVESGLHRLVRVESSRKVVPLATFVKPWGIARAPDGTVYVGDDASLLRVAPAGTKTPVAEAPAET